MRIHIVQKGETLWRIAKQYGVGLEELKHLNAHLTNPDYIVPGMEIILPDVVSNPTANPNANMTKEQLTAPTATKKTMTAPINTKEAMTAPTKEKLTEPIKEMPKEQPKKEHPIKEVVKEVLTKPMPMPMPVPMPMPQLELAPQFNFDFAPQMQIKQLEKTQPMQMPQPQPQPMPMPMPQPIFIEVPQMQMPQPPVETKIETRIEKEIEYVHVPHQQIIYVPYMVHQPMPCHPKQHHHPCPPPPCHQFNPCGNEMMPQQMEDMGFGEGYQMMPPEAMNDCGCGGNQSQQGMMPYDMPYFEPNYDVAPMMDVAPAMEMEMEMEAQSTNLPEWLLDSSEMKKKTTFNSFGMEQQTMMTEQLGNMHNFETAQTGNVDPMGYHYGNYSVAPNMGEQMPYMMPQQYMMMPQQYMMPQQFVQPGVGSNPYMNPYPQSHKPWTY